MKIIALEGFPTVHSVPLARVICDGPRIIVEADDLDEKPFKLIFSPHQAVKLTTVDCLCLPKGLSIIGFNIMEVENSSWIEELKGNLSEIDANANFMDKARHFLLHLGDNILEVIAWDIVVEN